MKVTQQTLPLFNEMYELKFSEDEMKKAFSVQEEVASKLNKLGKPFKSAGVGQLEHVIDNGVNTITHTMYLNDSWKGRIEIHAGNLKKETPPEESTDKKEEKKIIPLNTTSYFRFQANRLANNSGYTIKIKNIDPNLFHSFLENLHYCSQLGLIALTKTEKEYLESITVHDNLDWLVKVTSGPLIFEKLKSGQIEPGIINTDRDISGSLQDIEEIISWLMPGAKIDKVKGNSIENLFMKHDSGYRGNRENSIGYIESIFEKDNHRLGILHFMEVSYYSRSFYRRLFLLNHESPLFNYADIGRVSLLGQSNRYNYGPPRKLTGVLGKVLFTEEITLPTFGALDWIIRRNTGNDTSLFDAAQLKLEVKKFTEETRRLHEEEEEKKRLQAKLKDKIESIKSGKKLILNGMTITKDSINYEGQELKRDNEPDWVYNVILSLSRAHQFDDINWDSVFEEFLHGSSSKTNKGKIGDVEYSVKFDTSTNSAGIDSTKTYINEYRINKGEITECLRRAVCYTEQADFDEFLSNVSSCSLKFHRYLQTGVDFEVSGIRHNEGFAFKLPLERRKNLMYIVLGENEYKVRDTNRLINMQNNRDLGEIMELLLGDKVIEGLTIDDAKNVLKLAKIEYQDAIDKSKKLLDETEKTLKLIKQQNIQMNGVTVKEGYIVNGKLRQYVVENDEACKVYEYPTGRYICIVDKSTSQAGKDKLINRLYALVNDHALAKDIHTLN